MHSETLLKATMQRSGLVFIAGRTILSLNKIMVYNIKYSDATSMHNFTFCAPSLAQF